MEEGGHPNRAHGPRDPCDKINALEAQAIREELSRTGVSRYYLQQACAKGEITHIKSARMVLINYERLIDHLNGRD